MTLSAEQVEIRNLARAFAEQELRPFAGEWDRLRELPSEVFAKLAHSGFLSLRIPEVYGGLGLDLMTTHLAVEALSWGESAVGLAVAIHSGPVTEALLRFGTPEQQAEWFPDLASGARLGAFALSEEGAGSDPAALATRARRTEAGWVLEGEKGWVSNGAKAGLVLVFARAEEGRGGISAFLVDPKTPGFEVLRRERTLGLCALESVSVRLSGLELPEAALLGGEGAGWEVAVQSLQVGRLLVASHALGIAEASYGHALRYAREREQFRVPLSGFGAIQEKLAGMAERLAQSRSLIQEVAREIDGSGGGPGQGIPSSPSARAALAKIVASDGAMWIADEAVQIHGGYGYMREYAVERLMRDAKGTQIYEGTNEVLRWMVAREAIREAEEGRGE